MVDAGVARALMSSLDRAAFLASACLKRLSTASSWSRRTAGSLVLSVYEQSTAAFWHSAHLGCSLLHLDLRR
jgi:hypothetical protein